MEEATSENRVEGVKIEESSYEEVQASLRLDRHYTMLR